MYNQHQYDDRYKTRLCNTYTQQGHCDYGEKCKFAHGTEDLRQPPQGMGGGFNQNPGFMNQQQGFPGNNGGFMPMQGGMGGGIEGVYGGGFGSGMGGGYGGNKQQGVCRFFEQNGECRFGANCKFSHGQS